MARDGCRQASGRWGALLWLLTMVLTSLLILEYAGPLRALDKAVPPGSIPQGWWAESLSLTANVVVLSSVAMVILVIGVGRGGGYSRLGLELLLVVIAATAAAEALKVALGVARPGAPPQSPPTLLGLIHYYSFPSGHTARAFAVAAYCSRGGRLRAAAFWAWAALVGLSRVALGVHWFSDVVAGAVVGVWSVLLVCMVLGRRRGNH